MLGNCENTALLGRQGGGVVQGGGDGLGRRGREAELGAAALKQSHTPCFPAAP